MSQIYFKTTILFLLFSFFAYSQPKAGYYDAAVGKADAQLKTSLFTIIKNHTERSYNDLWTDFQSTDKRSDGKVWDMYSKCNFTFVTDQDRGSGGGSECEYYNREHSFPKSWFNDGYPMYTDLFHLYPTDKYVNNQRGNLPFGETSTPTKVFGNGSKLGNSTFTGYSGTIFEPIDEYKGDFARTYFYMVTCYEDKIASWSSEHLDTYIDVNDGNKKKVSIYPALNTWSASLLIKWHRLDPVSSKETNRNNAVEAIQKNRNPFIDYPMLAEHIWGNKKGIEWSFTSGVDELRIVCNVSPIPATDVLNITTDEKEFVCSVISMSGQILSVSNLNSPATLDVSGLNNGMYLLQIENGNRRNITKFIINR